MVTRSYVHDIQYCSVKHLDVLTLFCDRVGADATLNVWLQDMLGFYAKIQIIVRTVQDGLLYAESTKNTKHLC